MELYPLKFNPIFKDKLWGGQKIHTVLGKDFGDLPNCGETWELSGVKGNISMINNGVLAGVDLRSVLAREKATLVGEKNYQEYGDEFPLLIKFIDANQDLSIQVHPDDTLAAERHNSKGKTEMWYVMQADQGASLISGFSKEVDKASYVEHFESGRLSEILNREEVQTDDVFFLPAGRVHTIGEGLLIAEIQQTSDITYRIFDFDRVDAEGNKRELHVEEALDAIDYKKYDKYKTSYEDQLNARVQLERCEFFTTNKLTLDQAMTIDLPKLDSFKIYICLEGKANIQYAEGASESISMGDVILVPAAMTNYTIEPEGQVKLLESYID
ncbi:MAG: type I phosphomannose isomerase catalytic subunit [Cytophagales bacterium]|nr:type I phosphomannose isomerase catalytic subunit [Cytophagales bacterium]